MQRAFALIFALSATLALPGAWGQDHSGWKTYGGDDANSHYSSLGQIHRGNVGELTVAWEYASARGEALPATSELQVNPIVIDGILYGRNPLYNVFAIEAETGKEIWTHNPELDHVGLSNMRGLSYWQGSDESGRRDQRIFFSTGHFLMALDANTGEPIEGFGNNGRVDLRQGLGRDPESISINAPSPGIIFEDLIVMGSAVTESAGAAPGTVRAYDVRSGKIAWRFHTIPLPGEPGYETWPEGAWKTAGGANAWAGMSLDRDRGLVFVPTGSPTPDFDGSGRAGANLFANSVIALDASTGRRKWHYQTVHHDLWDRDLSSAPTLVTVPWKGKPRDMLAQASKQGVIYLLDRDTGDPVFPIEEVPVPPSQVPGEQAYPTQPRVTLPEPFTRQSFDASDLSEINPAAHAHVKKLFDQAQPFAFMRPPGLTGTILSPGFYGGANWGGGAFDPESGIYYINAMEAPHLIHIEAVEVDRGSTLGVGEFVFRQQCSGCHGAQLQGFYPYAPALTGLAKKLNRKQAAQTIVQGKGRMMPFAHLPRHEIDAVVEFLFNYSPESLPAENSGEKKELAYVFAGYNDFLDDRYYPAIKPPWGTLNAIDLASGKRLWQIPLGEYEQLKKEGVPPTGTRNYGGPVVTAGGLLIIAASSDEMLRIFDKESGELLWQYRLPAAGYATPGTYEIDGRQFIVVTCSGGKLGTATGDRYIAFSLPQADRAR